MSEEVFAEFSHVVAVLEEEMMGDEFRASTNGFCMRNCDVFEEGDENKFEYMSIFNQYHQLVEKEIGERLEAQVPGFTLDRLMDLLKEQPEERLEGDVFDLLLTMSDFGEFKDLMLSFKREKQFRDEGGASSGAFSFAPLVTPLQGTAAADAEAADAAAAADLG